MMIGEKDISKTREQNEWISLNLMCLLNDSIILGSSQSTMVLLRMLTKIGDWDEKYYLCDIKLKAKLEDDGLGREQ